MEITQIIPHVEALIFASDHPLAEIEIVDLLNNSQGFLDDLANLEQIQSAIEAIEEKYRAEFYSFELKKSGGGYQFLTKPEFYPTVAQLNGDKYLKKLSTAALETLSIIAYKQPITKSEIEAIRGVNSDYSIQKLLEKELIIIAGRKEEAVGKPLIYTTSKSFMDYFGLNSPDDLPKIREVLQEEAIHPTMLHHEKATGDETETGEGEEEDGHLEVSETGELLMRGSAPEGPETASEGDHPEDNADEEQAGEEPDTPEEQNSKDEPAGFQAPDDEAETPEDQDPENHEADEGSPDDREEDNESGGEDPQGEDEV